MKNKYGMLVVQPIISSYRLPYFKKIASRWDTLFLASDSNKLTGFADITTKDLSFIKTTTLSFWDGKLNYQKGVLSNMIKYQPKKLYIGADARSLSYWLVLVVAKIFGIQVYSHGQGAYRKERLTFVDKLQFNLMVAMSCRYICYTEYSKKTLMRFISNPEKLRVADNTILNDFPVEDKRSIYRANEFGVLFVGRLREQVGLSSLFEVIKKLNGDGIKCTLHVVGGGGDEAYLRSLAGGEPYIVFYGKIYDDEKIANISKECIFGIHPGNAGLSIVHYMSLSLIPIVHDRIAYHMGPEPSYILNKKNGLTYKYNDFDDLYKLLDVTFSDRDCLLPISREAYKTYCNLSDPDLGDKLIEIMDER